MFTEQLSEMSAEIGRLKIELKIALVYLKEAKRMWTPHTTNSLVDEFLAKHADLLDENP